VTDVAISQPRLKRPAFGLTATVAALTRSPRYGLPRRAVVAVGLVALAYHYTLSTLVKTLKVETPLAYLGLVPVIALLLAANKVVPDAREPAIHDRQVDYIIGVPLMMAALAFNILMPVRLSTMFWLWRLDLVSLPVFTAGTVALLFGVRTLWRLKVPVLFLLFAWPLPYSTLLVRWLTAFTNSTLAGLNVLLAIARVAKQVPGGDGSLYSVAHHGANFQVSVASACSGVNGLVGYLLVAVAFLTALTGGLIGKTLWLFLGLIGVWVSNVGRIFIILAAGNRFGERVAIGVLHPFMGLVTFNLVVLAMVLIMGRFGLKLRSSGSSATAGSTLRTAVPKVRLAVTVVGLFAVIAALANSSLRSYDLVATSLGAPRLAAFSQQPSHPAGWGVRKTDTYTWARPFFGTDSTWNRYQFTWDGVATDALRSSSGVISDVIDTSDLSSFSTYGVEACYKFHGFKLHSIRTVDLGGGITGNVLAYYNTQAKSDWTTVYWHWPVKELSGRTRYERMTLMMINTGESNVSSPTPSPSLARALGFNLQNALTGPSSSSKVDARLDTTRTFLVAFARSLITSQKPAASKGGRTA
jgi:exosortase/archaeosortase family protein